MNNHRSKLLVIVCLVIWSLAGSHVGWSQEATTSTYNKADVEQILRGLAAKFKKRAIANKSAAVRKANIYGWPITSTLTGGGFRELQKVGPDGTPLYKETYNDMVVKTSRADFLSDGNTFDFGVDGTSMTIGIWDSGKALSDHQEFGDRIVFGDRSPRVSGHATHVMGTALAAGVDPKAQGVAFNATGLSFDWNKDEGEAAEQAAAGLLISNHSYGLSGRNLPDWYFGSYIYQAQDWDEIMHAAPYYLMVTAAGNTRHLNYNDTPVAGSATDGYDLLLGFALAKNGITVAAADNVNVGSNGELLGAEIAPFSNFGPADDGRIKPDITGAGVDVYSSYDRDTANYRILSGTSMASPGVAASLLLMQQYHYVAYGNYMRAATLKGLTLHTADEAGDHAGPDPKFGWGILNSKRAAEVLDAKDVNSKVEELTLSQGAEYTLEVHAETGATLSVSISWTDPAYPDKFNGKTNDATPVLVNDLDLRVYKGGEPYLPWKLELSNLEAGAVKGDNKVDPFEKVEIALAEGEYTIVVSHKGQLVNTAQDFSLVVTGITDTNCAVVPPGNTQADTVGQDNASISWDAVDEAFYEVRYKAKDQEQWQSELVADTGIQLENLLADTEYSLQVRSLCSEIMGSDFSEVLLFRTAEAQHEEETNTDPVDPEGDGENTDGTTGETTDPEAGAGDTDGGDTTDGSTGETTNPDAGTGDTGNGDATGDGTGETGGTPGGDNTTDGSAGETTNPDAGTGDTGNGDATGDGTGETGGTPGGDTTDGSTGETTDPDAGTGDTGNGDTTGDGTGDTGNGGTTGDGTGDTTGGDTTDGSTGETTDPEAGTGDTSNGDTTGDEAGDTTNPDSGANDSGTGDHTTGGSENAGNDSNPDAGTADDNVSGPNTDDNLGQLPDYPDPAGPPFLEVPGDKVSGSGLDDPYGDTANDTLNEDEEPQLAWTPDGNHVVVVGNKDRLGDYYVVDLMGRVLLTGPDASKPIPVDGFSKGFYVLAFEVNGEYKAKKFAK
ncbi:S8 family serine peptidase [Robertkochia sediminum]|uniref:S8 family serine peptidase n=1 Tax=Robertkochia sediminum TaxID=2785326 RepID=UPI0019325307|nr:S8 family serine peptidase [Robertkochia sediminum]MBL7471830.1 S8 family serine peptidase [Robertkochia sediminum]